MGFPYVHQLMDIHGPECVAEWWDCLKSLSGFGCVLKIFFYVSLDYLSSSEISTNQCLLFIDKKKPLLKIHAPCVFPCVGERGLAGCVVRPSLHPELIVYACSQRAYHQTLWFFANRQQNFLTAGISLSITLPVLLTVFCPCFWFTGSLDRFWLWKYDHNLVCQLLS